MTSQAVSPGAIPTLLLATTTGSTFGGGYFFFLYGDARALVTDRSALAGGISGLSRMITAVTVFCTSARHGALVLPVLLAGFVAARQIVLWSVRGSL